MIGLFMANSSAIAAPPVIYPAPVVVVVNVNHVVVGNGGSLDFTGSGYLPGETIDITVSYRTASGDIIAGETITVQADANGNFSIPLSMTVDGVATLTAYGETSHRTGTLTVTVNSADSSPTTYATTTVPGSTVTSTVGAVAPGDGNGSRKSGGSINSGGSGNNGGSGSAGGSGGSVGTGGLAYTGASIAGPLTIGMGALIVGLALLFFGTRLAIRRKHRAITHR